MLVGYSTFFVKSLVEVPGTQFRAWGTPYKVHGFEGTGYLVSRVQST